MSLSKKFRAVFSMTYAKIGQNFTHIVEATNIIPEPAPGKGLGQYVQALRN